MNEQKRKNLPRAVREQFDRLTEEAMLQCGDAVLDRLQKRFAEASENHRAATAAFDEIQSAIETTPRRTSEARAEIVRINGLRGFSVAKALLTDSNFSDDDALRAEIKQLELRIERFELARLPLEQLRRERSHAQQIAAELLREAREDRQRRIDELKVVEANRLAALS